MNEMLVFCILIAFFLPGHNALIRRHALPTSVVLQNRWTQTLNRRNNAAVLLFSHPWDDLDELKVVQKDILALKFCLRNDATTPADSDIQELVATYGVDDKDFLRAQLTLAKKKELICLQSFTEFDKRVSDLEDVVEGLLKKDQQPLAAGQQPQQQLQQPPTLPKKKFAEQTVSFKSLVDLRAAIDNHPDDPAVIAKCCEKLADKSYRETKGVADLLVDVLKTHARSNTVVAEACCGAIKSLTSPMHIDVFLDVPGSIPALVGILDAHGPTNPIVAHTCCEAVRDLVNPRLWQTPKMFEVTNVFDALLNVLKAYGKHCDTSKTNGDAVYACLWAILCLANSSEENKSYFQMSKADHVISDEVSDRFKDKEMVVKSVTRWLKR